MKCKECGETFGHLEGCFMPLKYMKVQALINGKRIPVEDKKEDKLSREASWPTSYHIW